MDPLFTLLAIAVFLILISGLVILGSATWTDSGTAKNAAKVFAKSLGGTVTGRSNRWVISLNRGNAPMRLVMTPHKNSNLKCRISVPWPEQKLRIRIFPENVPDKLKKFLGIEDIQVGNSKLDPAYIIQANRVDSLMKILTPKVQEQILQIGVDANLVILNGTLSLEMIRPLARKYLTLKDIQSCIVLFNEMIEASFKLQGVEMTFVENTDSVCMVCGEHVTELKVSCNDCGTPHHRDCWEYLGMCSTYACGSTRIQS